MYWRTMDIFIILFLTLGPGYIHSLRDVNVVIPKAVRRGETIQLYCRFDTEGDGLYSVKWYKGGHEFYRFTPKQSPEKQMFKRDGLHVIEHMSNATQVTLERVPLIATGRYSCEVSAEAPSFHTLIANGELNVVEPPDTKPILTGIEHIYRVGDTIKGNCTSRNSKPKANVTWLINDKPVAFNHQKLYRPIKHYDSKETVIVGIQIVVGQFLFGNSSNRHPLKISCRATIYDVYSQTSDRIVNAPKYRRKSTSNMNSVNFHSPSDQNIDDEFLPNTSDGFVAQGEMSSFGLKNSIGLNYYLFLIILLNVKIIIS